MTNQQQQQHHHQQQQQYFEDDHTIETIANYTVADDVVVEVEELVFIHSVFIKINNRKQQERNSSSNVSTAANTKQSFETLLSEQYELKDESFFKSWFERKVINNPRNDRITNTNNNNQLTTTNTKLSIPKLCGLSSNLQIYFRKDEQIKSNSKSKTRHQKQVKLKPINKMATLLTFNPDTGLYGQLIRGNAYIVVINSNHNNNSNKGDNSDNNDRDDSIITVQILKEILELIYKYKNMYHQYGADFNGDGRTQLLQACSEYKNKYKKKMKKKNRNCDSIISNSKPISDSNNNNNDNNNNQQQQSDDERFIAVINENKKNVKHHTRTDTGITDDSSSSSSHSHSSKNSITNINNIIGSPKQNKRRSKSNDDEYVYSINILDEEISAVHSRNNSATTVDATKIKLLHPPLHPSLHIATLSTSTSTIVDSFENMADEIIFSFQQEVSKTIININDVEFKNNAELPSTTITITAGGTMNKNNISTNNSHSRKISDLSDTSTAPKTIQEEEELIPDEEEKSLLCDNNNSNNNNTDVVETTTTQIKKSHRMNNQSLPELLLLREESLYPDSHLRSVYNSIPDKNEKEDSKKSVLTHRSLQLHNNEIEFEQQQKQEVVNKKKKNHQYVVESILKARTASIASPISTPKTKTNYLSVYNILQSPSLSLQLSEASAEVEVATIEAPTTTTTTTTPSTMAAEDNDTLTLVSENTDNYNNCPKYYSSSSSPPLSPPSPPLPPQIPIPGIIVRRLTSI